MQNIIFKMRENANSKSLMSKYIAERRTFFGEIVSISGCCKEHLEKISKQHYFAERQLAKKYIVNL